MESSNSTSVIWRIDALPADTRKALEYLSKQEWLGSSDLYLAGGTALALKAGHRSSVDLDFFMPHKNFNINTVLEQLSCPEWKTDIEEDGTIYGTLFGAKVSFIGYSFFKPVLPFDFYGKIKVLLPEDIGVMKIVAVSQRGRKRDFIDLFWLCKNTKPLLEFARCLPNQYPSVAHDFHHVIKALVYFADAENDPMPNLNFKTDWQSVKKFFEEETKKIASKLLEIDIS